MAAARDAIIGRGRPGWDQRRAGPDASRAEDVPPARQMGP